MQSSNMTQRRKLTETEIGYLEELYVPHALAGVMAQNGKQKAGNVV